MAVRKRGLANSFWNAATVGAAGVSAAGRTGFGVTDLTIWMDVSQATVITVEVAHSESNNADDDWAPLYYLDNEMKFTFAAAGKRAVIIPDFGPLFLRLVNSVAGTVITAGYEIS